MLHEELSGKIISAFYKVYNSLGFGFLEKVYLNAFRYELVKSGFSAEKSIPIQVRYDGYLVGEYFADLLVENTIIVEIKAIEQLHIRYELQLINYLKATEMEVGLLLNFGSQPEIRRKIFTNDQKIIR